MLSKDVLRRLGELNRQDVNPETLKQRLEAARQYRIASRAAAPAELTHLPESPESNSAGSSAATGGRSRRSTFRDQLQCDASCTGSSTQTLPEGRELQTPLGAHYVIERPLHEIWDGAERWLQRVSRLKLAPEPADKRRRTAHADLLQMHTALPDSAMFLDLETCGFSGSMVFLAGVLVAGPKGITLVQLLARHYGEERAMLHSLWQIASQQTLVSTFNGKSFDWPVVRDRSILHHIEMLGPLAQDDTPHCDLLHMSRRRWKREVPNCKLQTLERHVCGRRRSGDIPGRDIPQAYHQFVRSKDAWEMRNILHHNALDLVTLFQLSMVLLLEADQVTDQNLDPDAAPNAVRHAC